MQKIGALRQFILDLNYFAAENLESFTDGLTITPAFRTTATPGELVVIEEDYQATFFIERYPYALVSEVLLFAQISAWLLQNDTEINESLKFDNNIDVLDDYCANIEIYIRFNERVIAREDDAGDIEFNGKRYAL